MPPYPTVNHFYHPSGLMPVPPINMEGSLGEESMGTAVSPSISTIASAASLSLLPPSRPFPGFWGLEILTCMQSRIQVIVLQLLVATEFFHINIHNYFLCHLLSLSLSLSLTHLFGPLATLSSLPPNRSSLGTSANYSPINEEGQQWSTGPHSSNGISNPPGWQNILQGNPSSTSPISSTCGLPRTSSADQSPIPSPTEAPYSANQPRNWNQGPTPIGNNRQQFRMLNAPLYSSNQHRLG